MQSPASWKRKKKRADGLLLFGDKSRVGKENNDNKITRRWHRPSRDDVDSLFPTVARQCSAAAFNRFHYDFPEISVKSGPPPIKEEEGGGTRGICDSFFFGETPRHSADATEKRNADWPHLEKKRTVDLSFSLFYLRVPSLDVKKGTRER